MLLIEGLDLFWVLFVLVFFVRELARVGVGKGSYCRDAGGVRAQSHVGYPNRMLHDVVDDDEWKFKTVGKMLRTTKCGTEACMISSSMSTKLLNL